VSKRTEPEREPLPADDVAVRVRAAGLKLTPQRLAIVRELVRDPTHPTAQELYERLLPSMPSMSFATVYNTLDALASRGLCSARALSPGPSRFDPNLAPHDHAVCDDCGLVRDVVASSSPSRAAAASPRRAGAAARDAASKSKVPLPRGGAPPSGFVVRSVEQIYRGLCEACAKRRAAIAKPSPKRAPAAGRKAPAARGHAPP
jgi:Fur family peroxide stress response transcriptional regulator